MKHRAPRCNLLTPNTPVNLVPHPLKAGDLEAKYHLKIFTKIWQAAGKRSHISSHSPHQGLGTES